MPTVTENVDLPASIDPARTVVALQLAGTDGAPLAEAYDQTAQRTIVGRHTVALSATGEWSLALAGNDALIPAGTRWARSVSGPGLGTATSYAEVPTIGGPFRWDQILADPPGALATAALDSTAARLETQASFESAGAQVDQTQARTERDRWLAFIRDAGDDTPSVASFHFIGGDICDGLKLADGAVLWVGSDSIANPGAADVIDPNDRYTINLLTGLRRNASVLENTPGGTFSAQLYLAGTSGDWLSASSQGGFPADRVWWPMTLAQDAAVNGGNVVVGALLVDSIAPTVLGFQILDSHLLLFNGFLGYASTVQLNLDPNTFAIHTIRKDATHWYIVGNETVPATNAATAPAYLVDDLATMKGHRSYLRIARVPTAQLTTPASWTFWNGSTWVAGLANATRLVDAAGNQINGPSGIHLTAAGHWILAAMALGDTHLNVYSAVGPQGPWRQHARVPVPATGRTLVDGIAASWHTKVIGHLLAPAEHSIVSLTSTVLFPDGDGTGTSIRRLAPMFVAVPWF